ncbi:MAG TPA: collagen-binding domain-containing protein [Chthoniobacterales bacterium]
MPLTGPPRIGFNKQDNHLRKLTLRVQRFVDDLFTSEDNSPHASRRVEAVVAPLSSFNQAILSVGSLNLNNQNIVVDSYDSRSDMKSTNGLYDVNKRQENGDIATDGNLIDAGNAHVYGDVSTNAGTASGISNVTGAIRTDFYQEPIPIGEPIWPSINPTPALVSGSATLSASSTKGAALSRYRLSSVSLSGGQTLTLAGNPDGSPSYIELYVTGDISVAGTSQIILGDGVQATIYFKGNVDIAGKGMMNPSNQPSDLLLYGLQPASGASTPHLSLGGNGQISAAVYAPDYDITVNGGGSSGHVFGSVVGKTVSMTGVTNLHYDEALGNSGLINNYQIVSWVEDTR